MAVNNLFSTTSYIETPFIQVKIGDHSFGVFNQQKGTGVYAGHIKYKYPNYINSLNISKINGTVNTYTLQMIYQITEGDDPNFLEKVFGQQATTRRMTISYGDYSTPSFTYKEEGCTITDVKSNLDVANSCITYTITAISDALSLQAGTYNFPRRVTKPSIVIQEILYNNKYGMLEVFFGMRDKQKVAIKNLIQGDDKEVVIEAKTGITILNYLNYLVNCMSPQSASRSSLIKSAKYILTIHDDLTGELGGPYFKISKVTTSSKTINSLDTYEVNIGYPQGDAVMSFSIDNDQTYSLLYQYSKKIDQSDYVYRINDNGEIEQKYSPAISNNNKQFKTEESDKTWWTQVTQYPIKATLQLKGLLRSAMLMTYIKVNVYFYGQKHISSGTYIITKQVDDISASGFRTTLSLTRIKGDD